jgi:hypothetical protein
MGVTPGQRGLRGWWLRWDDPERRRQRRDLQGRPVGPDAGPVRPDPNGGGPFVGAGRPSPSDGRYGVGLPDSDRAQADWALQVDRAMLPWWRRLVRAKPR